MALVCCTTDFRKACGQQARFYRDNSEAHGIGVAMIGVWVAIIELYLRPDHMAWFAGIGLSLLIFIGYASLTGTVIQTRCHYESKVEATALVGFAELAAFLLCLQRTVVATLPLPIVPHSSAAHEQPTSAKLTL